MVEPATLVEQATLMEQYGAQVVYCVGSHNNLGCAVGNALAGLVAGATWVDGSARGLGAGAGNAATEVLAAAMQRSGYTTGIDVFALAGAVVDSVGPLLPTAQVIDRAALTIGYAGVYSSFLLHAERAAERYGVAAHDILLELGARKVVGGQEDMVIDVAAQMANAALH